MNTVNCNRRDFLKATGLTTTGLIIGFRAFSSRALAAPTSAAANAAFSPNAFIAIGEKSGVTLAISSPEIGQNIRTTFAMILSDELGADLDKVKLHQTEPRNDVGSQMTAGSSSVRGAFKSLRDAAAAAREMLINAAAKDWGVAARSCRAENGFVYGPRNEQVAFEAIAVKASRESVPSSPSLKPSSEFKYIGKATRCLDAADIVTGRAKFGIDAMPENVAFAVVLRSPVWQGTLRSFDASGAKQMPGVKDIFQFGDKIAVIASNTWAAINASRAVKVDWNPGSNGAEDSEKQLEACRKGVRSGADTTLKEGDFESSFANSPLQIDTDFFLPLLAHVPMEPPNGTAWMRNGEIEIWGSSQNLRNLYADRNRQRGEDLPGMTGLPHDKIKYHQMRIGGGFGRKLVNDYVDESIQIAKQVDYPVKMVFTREDDIRHDRYRIPDYYRFRVGIQSNGYPEAIEQTSTKRMSRADQTKASEIMGFFPNRVRKYNPINPGVPGGALRGPGHNITSFVEQSVFDMMAEKAGIDPLDYHLALHGDADMLRRLGWKRAPRNEPIICELLKKIKEQSGWKRDSNFGYGLSTFSGYGSHCAIVALVSKKGSSRPVDKVFAAVHCGQVINPLGAKAQIEGGIIDCLGSTIYQKATLKNGQIEQSNFHDYKLLRMPEAPEVDVFIIDSDDPPQGLGEVSYPPMVAATTNALFDATGRRFTELPLR